MGIFSRNKDEVKGTTGIPQGFLNEASAKKVFNKVELGEFVLELSSKAPVPGGGGAAALAGALGAALGGMVANLTIGKPKYADVEDEISGLKVAAYRLQKELLELIDKDAEAFTPLAGAYRMASETESEKQEKERVMQACLKQAALVPLEIMEKCAEILLLLEKFAKKGSVLAVSDAGCGAALAKAAIQAAWLNVKINTRMIHDEKFASETDSKGLELLEVSLPLADRIYNEVEDKLK